MLQDYYRHISNIKRLLIQAGIWYATILVTLYLVFRAFYINLSLPLAPFAILLYLAEIHTIILMYGFLYSLWPRKYHSYDQPNENKDLQINMFVTAAGEPTEVVRETVEHAKRAADYYQKMVKPNRKPRVIVLNDGKARGRDNWHELAAVCEKLGVYHIARETNEGYKAGNINNGLRQFPADDPHNTIDCFFDSDFCAQEEFLIEILKPLTDNNVDFVQSPQRYKNLNTWVAKAAGAHQIFFFDYICPAKAYDNALFLCGTNYAIRRSALLHADGIDNRFVTEDYATSIHLHLLGKKGVFISKVLALGMAPMNLKEYFNQQTRWCKGCLDANAKYFQQLFFGPLNIRQKFHYFLSTAYYFIGVRDVILILAPIPYLFWGVSLIRPNTVAYLLGIYLPLMIFNFWLFFKTFQNPIKSLILDVISFPVFAMAFLSSVIGHNLPFTITVKKYERENPFHVYRVQLIVALLLIAGLFYSLTNPTPANLTGRLINYFWASYSALFLSLGFWAVVRENYSFKLPLNFALPEIVVNNQALLFNFAKASLVLVGAVIVSLALPVGYNALANETPRIVGNVSDALGVSSREELIVPARGVYYGYYLTSLNTHPQDPQINIVNDEQPSLAMFYQDWHPQADFNYAFLKKLQSKGVIPVVTWEPTDTVNTQAEININGAPQELILSGKYDDYIRRWARGAKDYRSPLFLRFAHEMNGNWYAWGNGNPDSFISMWKHVHAIFEAEGADNVIWVWSPNNTNQFGSTEGVLEYYPGDEYVDWVGYSGFNWGKSTHQSVWRDFDYISFEIYRQLSELNKPIMVAETSSVSHGGDKTGWFYKTLGTYIPQMSKIKAVILFNQNFGQADFSLDSGMNSLDVVRENIISNGYYLKRPEFIYR